MVRLVSLLSFFLFLNFLSVEGYAQRYYGVSKEEFGMNKIQSKPFQWRTFSSSNFEYNFYRGGEQITRSAADHLEGSLQRMTGILGYIPYEKVKIFVFNNPSDLSSTNLSSANSQTENGAIVDVKNGRILLAYSKKDSLFHTKLVSSVASTYVYELLYGGNIRESLESQILLNLPAWFTEGIAAYVAESDNSQHFDSFKDAILSVQSQKLSNLKGPQAVLVGQSIWNYIALKYGKDNISNILNLTRIIHDEQSSITSSLGISFSKFLREWRDFYVLGTPLREEPEEVVSVAVKEVEKRLTNLKPGEVDTDNYEFSPENIERYKKLINESKSGSLLSGGNGTTGRNTTRNGIGSEAGKYSSIKLFKNFLVSNGRKLDVMIDPVRQLGLGYSLSVNDVLQNHVFKFDSYFRPTTPLFKSYDFALSYGYLAKKTDLIFKYEKRSIDLETVEGRDAFLFRPLNKFLSDDSPEYLGRRIVSHKISAKILYPFSKSLRLEVTPAIVKNDEIDYTLASVSGVPSDVYFAPNLSLVFDRTKVNSFGVETGTKAKVSMDKFYHTKNELKNFTSYYLDIRHYQRIFKGLTAAGRLSYGSSSGNSPQYTFLGGVENSFNRSTYRSNEVAVGGNYDLKNILLYNFPGTLRGYDFGRLYGNSHLLGNVELRAHLAEYLPQLASSSSFVKNFQLVGFFDVGTAWVGSKGPFSRQNSLNTVVTGTGSFIIEVTNFKNPFLSGFGGGLRTSILGILLRADYAYGLEDGNINKPKFHISVGKDF